MKFSPAKKVPADKRNLGIERFYAIAIDGERRYMCKQKGQCQYQIALFKAEDPKAVVEMFIVSMNMNTCEQTGFLRAYREGQAELPDMSVPELVGRRKPIKKRKRSSKK